jgi:hypothetical protein
MFDGRVLVSSAVEGTAPALSEPASNSAWRSIAREGLGPVASHLGRGSYRFLDGPASHLLRIEL